jgi:hypothetical protein
MGEPEPPYLGPQPLPWARALIDSAEQPIPQYGTPEWAALPDTSRAKIAACVIAAEAWRSSSDPREVATRIRLEITQLADDEAREPQLWTADVVASVHVTATLPSYAELCRRRGEGEAEARADLHPSTSKSSSDRPMSPGPAHGRSLKSWRSPA